MDIQRQQVQVESFHYDSKTPEEKGTTQMKVGFAPIEVEDPTYPKENTVLAAQLSFSFYFENFSIVGVITQVNHLINYQLASPEDLKKEEIDEIIRPLIKTLERLTFEVTEITTDRPGVQLNLLKDQNVEEN